MVVFILIVVQAMSVCSGTDGYITLLNYYPSSDDSYEYECYTPTTYTEYNLSYGISYQLLTRDSLVETRWDVGTSHRFVTPAFNMGVYYCKITLGNETSTVQTTKIKESAIIKPMNSKSSITVNVGENVTIGFDTTFNPGTESLAWWKDGTLLDNFVAYTSISFTSVDIDKAGMYEMHISFNRKNREHSFIKLIVRECPDQIWGPPGCENVCEYCYNGGVCDEATGKCICAPGFNGKNCENECGGNRFGWNCENFCTSANIPDSCKEKQFCLPDPYGCSCVTGFKGLRCSEECSAGTFGADCAQSCHCEQGGCSQYTGQCTEDTSCIFPWTGSNCQQCQKQYYGKDCEFKCNKRCICHRITGECITGACQHNWIEPNCNIGIVDTSFTSSNEGQMTEVTCTILNSTEKTESMVLVKNDNVNENITEVMSKAADGDYMKYTFSVMSSFLSTYSCVIVEGGESAYGAIQKNIFLLPSYNGSLKMLYATSSSISIEWTEWNNNTVNGDGPVIGYFLYYREINSKHWSKQYQESLSGTVSDLMWDTHYTLAVSAVRPRRGGEGPVGKKVIKVKTLCGKPTAIENVNHEISITDKRNALVTWTKTKANSETLKCFNTTYMYNVYLKMRNVDGKGNPIYYGNRHHVVIENITANEYYSIYVTVSNQNRESDVTESIEVTKTTNDTCGSHSSTVGIIVVTVVALFSNIFWIIVFFWKYKRSVSSQTKKSTKEEILHEQNRVPEVSPKSEYQECKQTSSKEMARSLHCYENPGQKSEPLYEDKTEERYEEINMVNHHYEPEGHYYNNVMKR